MRLACMRSIASALGAMILIFGASPTYAQTADAKGGSARQQADADGQKKIDEFAEAARVLGGPAAHPECVWLGRRAVGLLLRDDLDTAFRHLDLYDRFGCPAGHIQAAFRCLVRQGDPDLKATEALRGKVHSCWINPSFEPTLAAPAAAAAPTTTNR
jgi:hypothetical protein